MVKCELVWYSAIWCISKLEGLKIHKTIIFHVVFHVLEALGGLWASLFVAGQLSFFFLIYAVVVKLTFPTC